MRVLLDTHVLLWVLSGDDRLSAAAREVLVDGATEVRVSAVSAWEITIKRAIGKLDAPDDLPAQLEANRFDPLDVTIDHALAVGQLPPLHRDPFDRLLVAQARGEGLALMTADAQIGRYDVETFPA